MVRVDTVVVFAVPRLLCPFQERLFDCLSHAIMNSLRGCTSEADVVGVVAGAA